MLGQPSRGCGLMLSLSFSSAPFSRLEFAVPLTAAS